MTDLADTSRGPWRGPRLNVVVGLGRPQESRLLEACRQDAGLRIVRRCSSAPDAIEVMRQKVADVALLDEDVHLLGDDQIAELESDQMPAVVLTRKPDAPRWRNLRVHALSIEAEPARVLQALREAFRGEAPAQARPSPAASSQSSEVPTGRDQRAGKLQVLAFWSGPGSPGRTTTAINCAALLGSVAPTILVDLDLTGAAVAAQLDGGGHDQASRVRLVPNIAQLALAAPDSEDAWTRELSRVLQPLGDASPRAVALAGIPRPGLRKAVTSAFVERLIGALRSRYEYVLLDLGDEPVGDDGRESAVARTALRAADHVLLVCPPDGLGMHQTRAALSDAGDVLDAGRTGLVVNRYGPGYHAAELARLEAALELPVLCVLPLDYGAVQRALAEGRPVVYDARSKLRRPLLEFVERIWGGKLRTPTSAGSRFATPWARLQGALAGVGGGLTGGASR